MSKNINDKANQQVAVLGDKEQTWRKYLFFDNGILVNQHFFVIKDGVEIPSEETSQNNYKMTFPLNLETGEHVKIENIDTGETKLIEISKEKTQIEHVKIYNETKNLGVINRLENGIHVASRYYKIENNQEVFCEMTAEDMLFFVPLPKESPDFSSYGGSLPVYNKETGEVVANIPRAKIIGINSKTGIKINEQNENLTDEIIKQINELSPAEKEKFIENMQNTCEPITTLEGAQLFNSSLDQVTQTIGLLLSNELEEIPAEFYKTVDPKTEFGISRVVADKMYNLPRLLETAILIRQGDTQSYIIQAEVKDSRNNSIRLEHRLQATSDEQANKIAEVVIRKLKGVQLKIWTACWKMANIKKRHTFTCKISELIQTCYPSREPHINSKERLEFYEHLRSLENTKFVYTRHYKDGKKKDKVESYEIRLLEIHRRSGEKGELPQELTMTILNAPALQKHRTTFVGVGVKNQTLELHADDAMLANIIQTRKSQSMTSSSIRYERDSLMELAGLSETNKTNKSRANKLLLEKLQRIREKGVILNCPKRITSTISLKIREL